MSSIDQWAILAWSAFDWTQFEELFRCGIQNHATGGPPSHLKWSIESTADWQRMDRNAMRIKRHGD